MKIKILIICLLCIILTGCTNIKTKNTETKSIKDIEYCILKEYTSFDNVVSVLCIDGVQYVRQNGTMAPYIDKWAAKSGNSFSNGYQECECKNEN